MLIGGGEGLRSKSSTFEIFVCYFTFNILVCSWTIDIFRISFFSLWLKTLVFSSTMEGAAGGMRASQGTFFSFGFIFKTIIFRLLAMVMLTADYCSSLNWHKDPIPVKQPFSSNALVICINGPPPPWGERGIALEISCVFIFALSPQCGGFSRIFCYIGKKGRLSAMK